MSAFTIRILIASCCVLSGCSKSLPESQSVDELPIVQVGHPILRQVAYDVPSEYIATREFQSLITKMVNTMRKTPGVGLAAPQVGAPLRIVVYEDNEKLMGPLAATVRKEQQRVPLQLRVLVNPVLTPVGSDKTMFFEGCLSMGGYTALVDRWYAVEVSALDEQGKPLHWQAHGWEARILQHEIDHLDGKLYIDSMYPRSFGTTKQNTTRFGNKLISDIRYELGL